MYFRETSWNASAFRLPSAQPCTLAFSRLLAREEALVAYNTSTTERRAECVIVDGTLNARGDRFRFRYGQAGEVEVEEGTGESTGARFVRLDLAPMEFVILERA
jgi:alpha-amylase